MPPHSPSPDQQSSTAHPWRRWVFVVVATLLLHWTVLNWATRQTGPLAPKPPEPPLVQAILQPPAAPPAPKPQPIPKPRKRAAAQTAKPRPAPAEPSPTAIAATDTEISTPSLAEEFPGDSTAAASKNEKPAAGDSGHYRIDPPPSAELNYDVAALREGQTVYGHGKIGWNFDGSNYMISGEAGVLFFTVLSFGSTGGIDESGIAPIRYSEKRFRRSETATHFTRERSTISFSASTLSYPLKGGEQDRASIIWQLAGIGRGDREKLVANTQIPVFVAGVRDGETWTIQVIGEEEIDSGIGRLTAWHLLRVPRPGSYDQKLDIWLAPQHEWYPVRLRYTDANGDWLDMTVSSITPPAAR